MNPEFVLYWKEDNEEQSTCQRWVPKFPTHILCPVHHHGPHGHRNLCAWSPPQRHKHSALPVCSQGDISLRICPNNRAEAPRSQIVCLEGLTPEPLEPGLSGCCFGLLYKFSLLKASMGNRTLRPWASWSTCVSDLRSP
jgi:hypothetical protein